MFFYFVLKTAHSSLDAPRTPKRREVGKSATSRKTLLSCQNHPKCTIAQPQSRQFTHSNATLHPVDILFPIILFLRYLSLPRLSFQTCLKPALSRRSPVHPLSFIVLSILFSAQCSYSICHSLPHTNFSEVCHSTRTEQLHH